MDNINTLKISDEVAEIYSGDVNMILQYTNAILEILSEYDVPYVTEVFSSIKEAIED